MPRIAPRLRPLDLGQKLDAAIKLTTRNFWTLAAIVTILLVPLNLVSFLITASTLPEEYSAGGQFGGGATPVDDYDGGFVVGQIVVNLLAFLAFFLGPAVCFLTISQAYLGGQAGWRESLGYAMKRLPRILLIVLLFGLAMVGCFVAAVFLIAISTVFPPLLLITIPAALVPFVYLGVVWSVALPALLLEDKGSADSLGRSFKLVKDRFWSTFGTLLLAWLLTLFIAFLVGLLLGGVTVLATDEESVTGIGLSFLSNLIASIITTPFLAAVTIVIYFDLRVRKEAFDLEMLAGAIGGSAPASPSPGMPWVAPPAWSGPVPGQPPGWGGPPPGGAPPTWGAPPPGGAPPAWGAPPPGGPPPAWGTPPPGTSSGWGAPQAGPGGSAPGWGGPPPAPGGMVPGWGAPPPGPGGSVPGWDPPPAGGAPPWGPPQQPPGSHQPPAAGAEGRRWEPPAPPAEPRAAPQRWEPPAPPGPPAPSEPPTPDPPDRSSS